MLDILRSSPSCNGLEPVCGRGLARRKLWPGECIALAADVATKQRAFEPSLGQVANLFGVTTSQIRAELKARAAAAQQDWLWLEAEDAEINAQLRIDQQTEAEKANEDADHLIAAWNAISPSAREAAFRVIGPAAVWDVLATIVT
jgi:hypothetical protein